MVAEHGTVPKRVHRIAAYSSRLLENTLVASSRGGLQKEKQDANNFPGLKCAWAGRQARMGSQTGKDFFCPKKKTEAAIHTSENTLTTGHIRVNVSWDDCVDSNAKQGAVFSSQTRRQAQNAGLGRGVGGGAAASAQGQDARDVDDVVGVRIHCGGAAAIWGIGLAAAGALEAVHVLANVLAAQHGRAQVDVEDLGVGVVGSHVVEAVLGDAGAVDEGVDGVSLVVRWCCWG